MKYVRAQSLLLTHRLNEQVERIQIIAGPRQIGKSTLVRQTLEDWPKECLTNLSAELGSAEIIEMDSDTETYRPETRRDVAWLIDTWKRARSITTRNAKRHVLVIDEIQKIPQWSEAVKALWDADRAANIDMHVVLLGSAPLLMQKGLAESLAGRF